MGRDGREVTFLTNSEEGSDAARGAAMLSPELPEKLQLSPRLAAYWLNKEFFLAK